MCTRKTLIKIFVLHCFRSLKCTFSPVRQKDCLNLTGLKGLMHENEHIQGYITDSSIVLAKEKDEAQPQFTSLAK